MQCFCFVFCDDGWAHGIPNGHISKMATHSLLYNGNQSGYKADRHDPVYGANPGYDMRYYLMSGYSSFPLDRQLFNDEEYMKQYVNLSITKRKQLPGHACYLKVYTFLIYTLNVENCTYVCTWNIYNLTANERWWFLWFLQRASMDRSWNILHTKTISSTRWHKLFTIMWQLRGGEESEYKPCHQLKKQFEDVGIASNEHKLLQDF